ncbi:MAG: hypothetical protein IKW20_08335 [Bacteroidales bacterium]|nr:hypothetical protein [Bacteroidales bacterium]
MYTWGYLKENALSKLNLSEEEANQQGFLSRFPYYANEAMTQICSAVRPKDAFFAINVTEDDINTLITLPDDFIGFSDDTVRYSGGDTLDDVGDEYLEYHGYNQIICKQSGKYIIPYKARWFFFTKDLHNATNIPAPADVCESIPSYIVSQCFKIDDEVKAAIYRNEFEMFLARIDDTSFKSQRTFHTGGGW